MSGPRPSLLAVAAEISPRDGLPNALSIAARGRPDQGAERFWAAVTWWVKFGWPTNAGWLSRTAWIARERFIEPRMDVPLAGGGTLSVPAALALINPPPWESAAARAAHTLAYSTIDYDLFDLVFDDVGLVRVILDFDAFSQWIASAPRHPDVARLAARYLAELHARRPAGIDLSKVDAAFDAWLAARGVKRPEVLAARYERPADRATAASGGRCDVVVYGHFSLPIGLGEDARLTAAALEMAGYRVNRVDLIDGSLGVPASPIGYWTVPALNLAQRALTLTPAHDAQRKILASPWELPRMPDRLAWVYRGVDTVCVYSDFVAQSLADDVRPRALRIPMAFDCDAIEAAGAGVAKAGIFTFVVMFDFGSHVSRKGPDRTIAAFRAAFPDGDEPARLVVKSINGDTRPALVAALTEAAGGDPRIDFIDEKWDSATTWRLLAASHVFVSLHASEGFGRILAESMLLGTQVIATGWSGSNEVCREDTALLVPYALAPISDDDYPFGEGQHWARPDIAAAADLMRMALEDWHAPRLAAMRQHAGTFVRQNFSLDVASRALHDVIERTRRIGEPGG